MSLAMEKQMGFQDFSNKQFLKFKVSQASHFEQIFQSKFNQRRNHGPYANDRAPEQAYRFAGGRFVIPPDSHIARQGGGIACFQVQ